MNSVREAYQLIAIPWALIAQLEAIAVSGANCDTILILSVRRQLSKRLYSRRINGRASDKTPPMTIVSQEPVVSLCDQRQSRW